MIVLRIVVLDANTLGEDISLEAFKKFGEVEVFQTTSKSEVVERIRQKDIIITNKIYLGADILRNAENLKLIALTATGTNNVDLEYAKSKGIAVANVAGYSTMTVAQHTFALLFYLYENLQYFDNYVKSGKYCESQSFTHLGRNFGELDGKVWGIIGLGAIGKRVANIASSFGCKVIYYSTSGNNSCDEYERVDKEKIFSCSDILSIHAPLNENTKNLVDYEKLSLMKSNSVLLNLGRGPIINEEDLTRALNENKIAGAGLDVLVNEPMSTNCPLLNVRDKEKLFITPHIAWASTEARTRLVNEIELNIKAFLDGEKRNRVE